MTETNKTMNQIIDYLNAAGHMAWRSSAMHVYGSGRPHKAKRGSKGIGDIPCAMSNGRYVEFEFKSESDKPRLEQLARQTQLQLRGHDFVFVSSLDDVINYVKTK